MADKSPGLPGRLEERCRERGVRVLYGELMGEGGLCRLRQQYLVVLNRRASAATRARIVTDALARLDAAAAPPVEQPAAVSEPAVAVEAATR